MGTAILQLTPGYRLFRDAKGQPYFTSGTRILALQPKFGHRIVDDLVQRLSLGEAKRDELLGARHPVEQRLVASVLDDLIAAGIIEETGQPADRDGEEVVCALLGTGPREAESNVLGDLTVAACVTGAAGLRIARALAGRVGTLLLAGPSTTLTGELESRSDTSIRRCETLTIHELRRHEARMILFASDRPDPAGWRATNDLSMASGIPWTSYRPTWGTGLEVEIGPTVIPGVTACFDCYRMRRRANIGAALADEHVEELLSAGERFPALERVPSLMEEAFALDVCRYLLTGKASTLGGVVTVNVTDMTAQRHAVLRMPWCDSCSGAHGEAGAPFAESNRPEPPLEPAAQPSLALLYHQNTTFGARRFRDSRFPAPMALCPQSPRVRSFPLPDPSLGGSLAEALDRRASAQDFEPRPLSLPHLATVLDSAYGTSRVSSRRRVPSGGARYPLDLYVMPLRVESLAAGVYRYAARQHRLEQITAMPPQSLVASLTPLQPHLPEQAGAALFLIGVPERNWDRYGDFGYRLMVLEAGHAGQNALLAAAALGLGALPYGGCDDTAVCECLGIDGANALLLYTIWLGQLPAGDVSPDDAKGLPRG
jgi:bacteriocin biosynthesis cyclodehydratase domain-containing protein